MSEMPRSALGRARALVPSSTHVCDDLLALERQDYEAAVSSFTHKVRELSEVLFVGQFGRVALPGVSDLDLVVVCEDGAFLSTRATCREIIGTIRNGEYLFWHMPTVLPLSMVQQARIVRTFAHLRDVWSRGSYAFPPPPSLSWRVRSLRAVIWNSFFWAIVSRLQAKRTAGISLRLLLLLVSNAYQGANSCAQLSNLAGSDLLTRCDQLRSGVLKASGEARRRRGISALSTAVEDWMQAEWHLASTWDAEAIGDGASWAQLEVGTRLLVGFGTAWRPSVAWRRPVRLVRIVVSRVAGRRQVLHLPMHHALVYLWAQQWMGSTSGSSEVRFMRPEGMPNDPNGWSRDVEMYECAHRDIIEHMTEIEDVDSYALNEILVSPFGVR